VSTKLDLAGPPHGASSEGPPRQGADSAAPRYPDVVLSRDDIRRALLALANEFARSSIRCEIAVMGGAAVVLLYGARAATKDVDAVILSPLDPKSIRTAVERVATTLGLPNDWLNDAAKGYVHGLALGDLILDEPSLVVRTLSPHQLLAMKLSAWRDDVDIEDARLLLTKVPTDRDEAWRLVEPHIVPGREIKAHYAFCDLWEAEHGSG
jgi:hypothetical protein